MGFVDKVFGLILIVAGIGIAIYWTAWQFLSLPILQIRDPIFEWFLEPYYLFKLPAFILIAGLLMIDNFVRKTNKNVAEEKARKAAEAALKNKSK